MNNLKFVSRYLELDANKLYEYDFGLYSFHPITNLSIPQQDLKNKITKLKIQTKPSPW